MDITETLQEIWEGFEEKCWGAADFLEDKGIPLSSFCQDKGINPAVIFGGVILAMLIFLVMSFSGPATGDLHLTVKDMEGNPPTAGMKVVAQIGLKSFTATTDASGNAVIKEAPFDDTVIMLDSNKYKVKSGGSFRFSENEQKATVIIEPIMATLSVKVQNIEGSSVSTGVVEVRDYRRDVLVDSKPITGSESYEFELPVDTYEVRVLSVSGDTADTKRVELKKSGATQVFGIDVAAGPVSEVVVEVKDENGQPVSDATVTLWNFETEQSFPEQVTNSEGEATFYNIPQGIRIFATAYVSGDLRYREIRQRDGKEMFREEVDSVYENLNIVLSLNGIAVVNVYDENNRFIEGASVVLMDSGGVQLSEEEYTDSNGLAVFKGIEERTEVYPVVSEEGFVTYEGRNDMRAISYSGELRFDVKLETDGSYVESQLEVVVKDEYDSYLDKLYVILSDAEDGRIIEVLGDVRNATFNVDRSKTYDVSVRREGYVTQMLRAVSAGTHDIEMTASTDDNSAAVEVCTYTGSRKGQTPAKATVVLRSASGIPIATDRTTDSKNCLKFEDLETGLNIFAKGTASGYPSAETPFFETVPKSEGVMRLNLTFESIEPVVPETGDIEVCVRDGNNKIVKGARILLMSAVTEVPTPGLNDLSTDSRGCAVFRDLPIEVSIDGAIVPLTVYARVLAEDYLPYEGNEEENFVDVQPDKRTPLNVRLSNGEQGCITVFGDSEPIPGASVMLCSDQSCSTFSPPVITGADGHANIMVSAGASQVFVKVFSNKPEFESDKITGFRRAEVTKGQCGMITLAKMERYLTISIDGTPMEELELMPREAEEIEFFLRLNGQALNGNPQFTNGRNTLITQDGITVFVDIEGVNGQYLRAVDSLQGKYAMPFIAPDEDGQYQALLSAQVSDCMTCRGDEKIIDITVGEDLGEDEDNDGVADDYDMCPGTPEGSLVDEAGCPTGMADSDGDGVMDNMDKCPNTPSAMNVDANGCPTTRKSSDSDNDGIMDDYDMCPGTPLGVRVDAKGCALADSDNDGIPDIEDTTNDTETGGWKVKVCVVGDRGYPVRNANINIYEVGEGPPADYSSAYGPGYTYGYPGGYNYPASGYGYPYASEYTQYDPYAPQSSPTSPNYNPAKDPRVSSQNQYAYQNAYHRPPAVKEGDNCKMFSDKGYSFLASSVGDTFLLKYRLKIRSEGYYPFDSEISKTDVEFSLDSGDKEVTLTVRMMKIPMHPMWNTARPGTAVPGKGGTGKVEDPKRTVSLAEEGWKSSDNSAVYPSISKKSHTFVLNYDFVVDSPFQDMAVYRIVYTMSSPCYEITGCSGGQVTGNKQQCEKTITLRYPSKATDKLSIKAKSSCLQNNDPRLEDELQVKMEGKLLSLGYKDVQKSQSFQPLTRVIGPLIKSEASIKDTAQLTQLKDKHGFADGVITGGRLPYCINAKENTENYRYFTDDGRKKQKTYLEFQPSATLPEDIQKTVDKMGDNQMNGKKVKTDCQAFVKIVNDGAFKNRVLVGQAGNDCSNVKDEQGHEPWEVLFCKAVDNTKTDKMKLQNDKLMYTK